MFTISAAKPLLLAVALLTAPGSHTSRNLRDIFSNVLNPPDFQYVMLGSMDPLSDFLPKDKTDWSYSYFVKHPKELSVGLYLLEKGFYASGDSGVVSFMRHLIDDAAKTGSKGLQFDASILQFQLPERIRASVRVDFSKISFAIYSPPKHLSLSQFMLYSGPVGSRGFDFANQIDWKLSQLPNNSYVFERCGDQVRFFLHNSQAIKMRGGMTENERKSGFFTSAKCVEFYAKAAKADPKNIGAWFGLGMAYSELPHPNYGEALLCYKRAAHLLAIKGGSPSGSLARFLNGTAIPRLEKKVNPS